MRARLATKYILFEIAPGFVLGLVIFTFILLMFQLLRLTEFILIHGGSLKAVGQIMLYLSLSFLPILLPMSLLFSILLTYSRLNSDSEIIALKSLGLNRWHLAVPALLLASFTAAASAHTSFYLAPWANQQFEALVAQIGSRQATATIREGVFSEGFFNMVVYANKVDQKEGLLERVFIFDERDKKAPLTIIAQKGQILQETDDKGVRALLRLTDGNIHRSAQSTYTKIDFGTYDIQLYRPFALRQSHRPLPSFSIDDLRAELIKADLPAEYRRRVEVDFHRRWALVGTCFVFGFLGVGLGASGHRRSAKGNGAALSVLIIISFWLLYLAAEAIALKGLMPTPLALGLINFAFLTVAAVHWRRV